MYANTCWGLLGLAVTFGLAVLGLPTQYEWLAPWLLGSAVLCGVGSVICFCWPLHRKANRDKLRDFCAHPYRAAKLIEPPHVVILGLVIALGGAIWQLRRADPRISELQSQLQTARAELETSRVNVDKSTAPRDEVKNPLVKNVAGPPIEWRFDKPVTVFMYSRKPGDAVRIEAILIHGTNRSDFALKKVSAFIAADMKSSQLLTMRVNPHGTYLEPDKSASVIPARAAFDLLVSVEPYGMTAEEFLKQYGSIYFSFSFENAGTAANFNELFSYSYLEDQIAFIEEKTRKGM